MAVVFMDGFDHYSLYESSSYDAQVTDNGWSWSDDGGAGGLRGNNNTPRFEDNNHGGHFYGDWTQYWKSGLSLTSAVAGCAFYNSENWDSSNNRVMHFVNNVPTTVSLVWFEILPGGYIEIRDSTDAIKATSTNNLVIDQWHYIEFVVTAGAGTGTAQVWVDGDLWCSATGMQNGTSWDQFRLYPPYQNRIDDFYLTDDSTERYDQPRIVTLYPQGQGAETGWNGTFREVETTGEWDYRSGHVDNRFISTNGPSGTKESWTYNNLPPGNWDIKAVRMPFRMQNAGAGSPSVTIAANSGASTSVTLTNNFIHADVTHMYRDGSSLPWTKDSINNLEMSVEFD
jgi:hypothetical protein